MVTSSHPTPTQLLCEAFSHAAITAQRLFVHVYPKLSIQQSTIIINTHTTPGMSDHESVTFNVNLNPVCNKKPPHKVYSYKSVDWDKLKDNIDKLNREYLDMDTNSQDIDINWTFFRERLTTLININIPRRYTKAKTHLPWITRELIRMQRRRNKSHKKANQTGLNSDWEKFKELQKQATTLH